MARPYEELRRHGAWSSRYMTQLVMVPEVLTQTSQVY